jgi:hypothetical protein
VSSTQGQPDQQSPQRGCVSSVPCAAHVNVGSSAPSLVHSHTLLQVNSKQHTVATCDFKCMQLALKGPQTSAILELSVLVGL